VLTFSLNYFCEKSDDISKNDKYVEITWIAQDKFGYYYYPKSFDESHLLHFRAKSADEWLLTEKVVLYLNYGSRDTIFILFLVIRIISVGGYLTSLKYYNVIKEKLKTVIPPEYLPKSLFKLYNFIKSQFEFCSDWEASRIVRKCISNSIVSGSETQLIYKRS